MNQVRLSQALRLVLYGHDEASHPIAPTLTQAELTHADVRAVMRFVSEHAAQEVSARQFGLLDLGGEGG